MILAVTNGRRPSERRRRQAEQAACFEADPKGTCSGAERYELALLRSRDSLSDLEAEWRQLYEYSAPRNPFLSYDWTRACWETHGQGSDPFILTARANGRLVGLAPLCIEKGAGFRIVRFMADGRSDYLGFLCASDCSDAERGLLHGLAHFQGEWDLAVLRQLVDSYTALHVAALPPTLQSHVIQWGTAPYTAWDGDWEALHDVGPSWLKRMRKRLPRFLRDGWALAQFTGAEAADRLPVVADIEARSWKGREGADRLQPGPGQELFRRAFRTLGARGEMELWLASIHGDAMAFQINFVLPGRLWIYQLAFAEEFQKSSVGSFLGYVSIERAWRAGAREYDYMAGDEPYKAERTTAARSIYHLAAYRRTFRGRLSFALLLAPRWRLRHVGPVRAAYQLGVRLRRAIIASGR
jgi:CelD/BcsL family acetyltransferase involved in cellulose biosynthesis